MLSQEKAGLENRSGRSGEVEKELGKVTLLPGKVTGLDVFIIYAFPHSPFNFVIKKNFFLIK